VGLELPANRELVDEESSVCGVQQVKPSVNRKLLF
jgi:hypothetical protein